MSCIKEQKISKANMRQMIVQMSDMLSQSQGSVMQTQSSGFGMGGGSILNHTLKSDMQMSSMTQRKTAREFFSKDNVIHPTIEENKQLKSQLNHFKSVKASVSGNDAGDL